MIANYADLEISLYYRNAESYTAELRFRDPEALTDDQPRRGPVCFDFDALHKDRFDSLAYGQRLTASFFADTEVQQGFEAAYVNCLDRGKTLHLRLHIDHDVPELHSLHWETLLDPRTEDWLVTGERIVFSRFMRSSDPRSLKLRPKGELRALVFIANPTNLVDGYHNLAPVQVEEERQRARDSLGHLIKCEIPAEGKGAGYATLNALVDALSEPGGYDILYLICHGMMRKKDARNQQSLDEPFLLLEREDGTADLARGVDLVNHMRNLLQQPWLVVLASCQSAGRGDVGAVSSEYKPHTSDPVGALASLGVRLADTGVPAVLAMQGNIMIETVERFMPRFFKQLNLHGQIDRAVGFARGSVLRTQSDWWMPVLFMRLREGRIWYEPGFSEGKFEKWPVLLKRIRRKTQQDRCTPILGSGLLDPLLGSSRELARSWAKTYHFPLAPTSQEDLPQVAQYLRVNQDDLFPYSEFRTHLVEQIQRRYGHKLGADLQAASDDQLDQLIAAAAAELWKQNPDEPHLVLAKLPFEIYITTNPDNLLAEALDKVGRKPHVEAFPWNDKLVESYAPNKWQPSITEPLVYHLFGQLNNPDSLVLTEDDYFDFLIGVTDKKRFIPAAVLRAETDGTLMFLGFQLDDWNFRVLFRSVLQRKGNILHKKYSHVAVQIVPEEGRMLETDRARHYLESYFGKEQINISIYWGSSEEFIRELRTEWNKVYGEEMPI